MATAFPVDLPRVFRATYAYNVAQPHAEGANDRGLTRRRRLGTGKTVTATLTWRFTEAQFQTFSQWWRDDIGYGCDPFEIQLLNGYDDVAQDVRAKGPYTAANLIGLWEISLPVEFAEAPVATQDVMQEAIDHYDDLVQANAFHRLAHIHMPWCLDPDNFAENPSPVIDWDGTFPMSEEGELVWGGI